MLHEDNNILNINNVEDLCNILNISLKQLKYLLFVKRNKYIEFEIPKKNGDTRRILSPVVDLKIIQKKLAILLYNSYEFLDVQHGFIKNRSCLTNANLHIGKRFVLNIDLENFFDTIHFGRVRGLFMNKPYNYNKELATYLAMLVCENGKLPQGAPTSPVISNIICYTMDKQLNHLAKKNRCVYSRYADDITFSTNSDKFPLEIAEKVGKEIVLSDKLIGIINGGYQTGFKINNRKTRLSKRMMRQEVTGVIVNKKANLSKKYIKEIRAILYTIRTKGLVYAAKKNFSGIKHIQKEKAKFKMFNYLQGKLNYLKMIRGFNDKVFLKYAKEFNDIFGIDFFDVDSIIELQKYAEDRCFVLQSENEDSQGTAFLVSGNKLYTSTHILINKTTSENFIYDESDENYSKQFPIKLGDGILPFFKLKKFDYSVYLDYKILEQNYKTDILCKNDYKNNFKKFKVARTSPNVGDTVYLIGYPNFLNFQNDRITILKTDIISKSSFLGREFWVTKDSPRHGMSGGPVLNQQREVVGIVYAGADLENDYNSDKVGFISLI